MAFGYEAKPISGPAAFMGDSENHLLSQSAILLSIGRSLYGDDVSNQARQSSAIGETTQALKEGFAEDVVRSFPIPKVRHDGRRLSGREGAILWEKHVLNSFITPDQSAQFQEQSVLALHRAAESVYADPSIENAVLLFEGSLKHANTLVRVAAAHAYLAVTTEPDPLINVLVDALTDEDELTREVAATALARFDPSHPELAHFSVPAENRLDAPRSHTSFIVHGTWARNETWWQPGVGDFHNYAKAQIRPDLYSAPDRFDWSGGYSDFARASAANELRAWVAGHNLAQPALFAHSHGGSVAMLASQAGLQMEKLILLSCPAHIPKYLPDYRNIRKVVSIRVKLDLVILADGGGQSYASQPQIQEHFLDVWFNHSASHDPSVWQRNDAVRWI